jgi:hypothetical protein
MVEELIDKMFAARNAAHIEHWKTKNGEVHRALGEYYDKVIDIIDKYVEAHQGTFGIVGEVKGEMADVPQEIHDLIIWLNENRSKIAREVPALENILDELTGMHMTTLYKLENLR